MVPKRKCYRCLGTGHVPISSRLSVTRVTKQAILLKHVRRESPRKANKLVRKALRSERLECTMLKKKFFHLILNNTCPHNITSHSKELQSFASVPVTMELDTGAGVTIVSETTWAEKLNKPDLQDCSVALHSYPNRSLNVMGSCSVEVSIYGQTKQLVTFSC